MKKTIILLSLLGSTSFAFANNDIGSYLTDSRGHVVKSGSGLCVHTSSWKPGDTLEDCDEVAQVKNEKPYIPDAVIYPKEVQQEQINTHITKKEVLSANILFGFDKHQISNEGKNLLNKVIEENGNNISSIIIIGYTDPIGSTSYNQTLSTKRAQAVKDYLVSQGFKLESIHSEGRGETELKVSKENCYKVSLIKCFAPNRRVEITINN